MVRSRLLRIMALVILAGVLVLAVQAQVTAAPSGYTLSVSVAGQGSVNVTPQQPSYEAGQIVTLTASPTPGWRFVQWDADLPQAGWWDGDWPFRFPLTVNSGAYPRYEFPVEAAVDFTALLQNVAATGPFAAESLRVVEVSEGGQILNDAVPIQFDLGPNYDPSSNAVGTLIFLLGGATPANAVRNFHVYFATADAGLPATQVTPLIVVDSDAEDEGQSSFEITTPVATYLYQKQGAGFSSILDSDGRDWVSYTPGGGASGEYRGIPNMPNQFHPGLTTGESTLVSSGPLKAVVRSVMTDTGYKVSWAFYPRFARMTVERFDEPYWFLYEGTPGGALNKDSDFIVRADGTTTLAGVTWNSDLAGEEWLYFADPAIDRAMFFVQEQQDNLVDSYFALQGRMTVFGFGRQSLIPYLTTVPQSFTMGLKNGSAYASTKSYIEGTYKPAQVNAGAVQKSAARQHVITATNPLLVTMNGDATVKAVFEREAYTLTVDINGQGEVVSSPVRDHYFYGEKVTLVAVPAEGWFFAGWNGAAGGTLPQVTLTITGDTAVTAAFAPEPPVSLDVTVVGNGQVQGLPPGQPAYGDEITLTAVPSAGWRFAGWSGELNSASPQITFLLTGEMELVATFEEQPAVTLTVTIAGQGSVTRQPAGVLRAGDEVTLTAVPAPGWRFGGWSGALNGTANPAMLVVNEDTAVTALFTEFFPSSGLVFLPAIVRD